jgi:hypothetical protein
MRDREATVRPDRLFTAEISWLMSEYFRCVDAHDFVGASNCFTTAVTSEFGGMKLDDGRSAIAEFLQGAMGHALSSRHYATSVTAEQVSDRTARSETAALVFAVRSADAAEPELQIRGVRYIDDLELVDGDWLISNRVHRGEWAARTDVTVLSNPEFTRTDDGSMRRQ